MWPELLPGLDIFWNAFWELQSDRQSGMGVGPIPYTAISCYANDFGFIGDDFDDLVFFVRQMDDEFLKFTRDNKPGKPTKAQNNTVTF